MSKIADILTGQHLLQVPGEMPAFERMWMGLMHLLTRLGARVHTLRTGFLAGDGVEAGARKVV